MISTKRIGKKNLIQDKSLSHACFTFLHKHKIKQHILFVISDIILPYKLFKETLTKNLIFILKSQSWYYLFYPLFCSYR